MQKEVAIISVKKLNPDSGGVGGTQAVVLWILEALKGEYQLTLYCRDEPLQLQRLNQLYGTNLSASDFRQVRITSPRLPKRLFLLERSLLLRRLRKTFRTEQYAAVVSADKEIDLGRKVIQYLHHPVIDIYIKDDSRADVMHKTYHRVCAAISGVTWEGLKHNISLTNSSYSAKILERRYGIKASVVYPPTLVNASGVLPWNERKDMFVMIARLSPEKRIEDAVKILQRIRETHPDTELALIGPDNGSVYAQRLRDMLARHAWVHYLGSQRKTEIGKIFDNVRYFINTRQDEPFGMVVAEAQSVGVIPFVFDGGGQTEIVADPRLVFSSEDDAVEKIESVMGDEHLQSQLASAGLEKRKAFSPTAFSDTIRCIMKEAI